MAGRIIICCLFFLISSYARELESRWVGTGPNPHINANDGSSFRWSMANKITSAQETLLQSKQTLELTNLQPWGDKCDGTIANCNRDSNIADSPASDLSSCGSAQLRMFRNQADSPFFAPNTWATHYLLYTPTSDIELIVELTKWGLHQTYSPKMWIFSYRNSDWTDQSKTPADSSDPYSNSMYCNAVVLDVCENSTMPVSYMFFQGNTYLIQLFAFGLPTPNGLNTMGNFYLRFTPATQVWIETFNNVSLGSLPNEWIASINATTSTRLANSTWVVGDVDYLSTFYDGGGDARYVADYMQPSGGVAKIQRFLGLNPTIFCRAGDKDADIPPCKRNNEYVITSAIDLRSFSHLEFQFSSVLDNQYRPPDLLANGSITQGKADWYVTVFYSFDKTSWNTLIGGNFPLVSTQTENPALWLTYQFNANVLAGNIVYLRFNFNMTGFSSTRPFGIDNLRFIDTSSHQLCSFPYACGTPTCIKASNFTINQANPQGYYGCGYTTNDTVCQVNNNTCTTSVCQPETAGHDSLGCTVTTNVALCTAGNAECEIPTCSPTTGCSYSQDDTMCQSKTSSLCADYWCDTTAHLGCQVAYSSNFTLPVHHRNPATICDDGASCSTDVCEPTNSGATVDSYGCSHTAIVGSCATGDSNNAYGNSECVTSVCDPIRAKTAANAFDDSVIHTGCFSELHDTMCTSYSSDCEARECRLDGCHYTQDATQCNAASACITPQCVPGNGCDYSDNTTKINDFTECYIASSCQIVTCVDDQKTTDGCHYVSDDSYCQSQTTNCTIAVCKGFDDCDYSNVNHASCSDGYSCTNDVCTNSYTDPAGDHPALSSGCSYIPVDTSCTPAASCATGYCDPSNSNTGFMGCVFEEHDDQCTGDVACSNGKCNNVTGCSYIPDDTSCANEYYPGPGSAPTCNIYKCYTLNRQPGDDIYEWSHKDANGCYIRPNCADAYACTIDTCESDSTCKHTEDNSKCSQSLGCSINTCEPYGNKTVDADGCHYVVRCDDKIDCTIDECVNTTAGMDKCLHTIDMTLCDDGVDCTYELLCDVRAGATKVGPIVKQYDNITGCIRVAMNEWCDDSNPCTIDVCHPTNSTTKGGCQHYEIDCDDGVPCTLDTCDILTGNCVHTDKVGYCDDDIACTVDKCDRTLAMCTNVPNDNLCGTFAPNQSQCVDAYCRPSLVDDSTGCFFLDRSCNDGIACTDDTCDPLTGDCTSTPNNLHCADGGECTDDVCDVALGKCTNIPNSNHCNDDLVCTVDFCDCETGNCVHTFVDCSDEIACTVDACNEATGLCTNTADHDLCDDGVLCTVDYCDVKLGRCVNTINEQYCIDNAPDKLFNYACRPPVTLTNYSTPHINGCIPIEKDCNDGIMCTIDYVDAITGDCVNEPSNAKCGASSSECNDITCSATLGCISTPNDTRCEDSLNCTIDVCGYDGKCQHNQLYCNDEVGCTDDRCDESLGGVCVFVPNNSSCDDSIDCTRDICDGKQCLNIPTDELCSYEESECSFGVCSIAFGGCEYEQHDELCNDRLQCTLDYCDGVNGCAHAPQDGLCDDNIPCTSDTCDINLGCVHTPHNEWCVDNVTCTDDICDVKKGCQFVPRSSLCNDNLDCTIDTCDVHQDCIYTPQDSACTDGISCTMDKCDTSLGRCTNTPMPSWCSDDFSCSNETCDPNAPAGTTGCLIDINSCSWADPVLLYLHSESAKAQFVEKRGKDGSGSSFEIITADGLGELKTRIHATSENQVLIGGGRLDVPLSAQDGLVINSPLRLVPVTSDSIGECNEIRRGTIRVVETSCGDGRDCTKDIILICVLEDTYVWREFKKLDS